MKRVRQNLTGILAVASALAAAGEVRAGLTLTYFEDPAVVNSTLQQTSVTDFSSWATQGAGVYKNLNWSGVGSIDQVYLQKANLYGGATGTGYYPVQSQPPGGVGGGSAISETVLTLSKPVAYFGLWWSAGDSANTLSFYSDNNLIATFSTKMLVDTLSKSYYGNPTAKFKGQDSGEPFAFLNVYADPGVTWNKVVFDNSGSSGFESDNWTVRSQAWGTLPNEKGADPGVAVATVSGETITPVPVPESRSVGAIAAAFFLQLLFVARAKRSKVQGIDQDTDGGVEVKA